MAQVSDHAIIRDMEPEELKSLCMELYAKCKGNFTRLKVGEWMNYTQARAQYRELTGVYLNGPDFAGT